MPGEPCWQPWSCTNAYVHIPPCVSRGQEEILPSAWVCTRAWWSSRR
jgi:hypothetical protein